MPLLDLNEPAHRRRLLLGFLALLTVVLLWLLWRTVFGSTNTEWSYTHLVQQANGKSPQVKRLDISGQNGVVTDPGGHQYQVHLPPDSSTVAKELADKNVDVYYVSDPGLPSWLQTLLVLIVVIALGGAIYAFLFRRTPRRY